MDLSRFFNYDDASATTAPAGEAVQFLTDWTTEDWREILMFCTWSPFKAGQAIIRKGESRQSFFIVVAGELEVLSRDAKGKTHRLAVIPKGTVFGEQGFIEGTTRSADVVALTNGEVLELNVEQFEVFSAQHPKLARDILWDLAKILSIRLRATSAALLHLKR